MSPPQPLNFGHKWLGLTGVNAAVAGLPDEWSIPTELSPDSDMSVDSVTSEVSESVVCMSVVSLSGMKPNMYGCGLELVRTSCKLFVLFLGKSGLVSSTLLDETLLGK